MKKIHLSEYYQSIETNIINLLLTSIHFLLDLQQVPFIYEAINTLKSVPHWGHPALGLIYLYQVMSCRQECPLILFSFQVFFKLFKVQVRFFFCYHRDVDVAL